MVDEEEGTNNREYCRECGWCIEDPFTEGCIKWKEEIAKARAASEPRRSLLYRLRVFFLGEPKSRGKK